MSSHHLRKEKDCLNCGQIVEDRYCGHCGQENIEPRQTFGHLVAHFFEDLTHYEGKFWGTLKYLFFRPAYLTKQFIAGKRSTYLPPVRLYIFASFITFFITALLPEAPGSEKSENKLAGNMEEADSLTEEKKIKRIDSLLHVAKTSMKAAIDQPDSVPEAITKRDTGRVAGRGMSYNSETGMVSDYSTLHDLDSARKARAGTDDPMDFLEYAYNKKAIDLNKYPKKMQWEMFKEAMFHNFPKALFIYMPLFALILRLFHRKKNWIYFDHGIFTLHYFSFLLLIYLFLVVLSVSADWVIYIVPSLSFLGTFTSVLLVVGGWIWAPYYLFRAHRNMYGESTFVSMSKVWGIIWLNLILFILLLVGLAAITFFTLH